MEKDDLKIYESLMYLAVALKSPIPKVRNISQMEEDELKIDESLTYLAVALKRPQIPYAKEDLYNIPMEFPISQDSTCGAPAGVRDLVVSPVEVVRVDNNDLALRRENSTSLRFFGRCLSSFLLRQVHRK